MIRYAQWDDGSNNDSELEGWRPLWLGKNADPASFLGHDVIDHMRGDTPTIEQELMALGSWFYLRAENGIGTGYITGKDQLSSELLTQRRYLFDRDGGRLQTPPKVRWSAFPESTLQTFDAAIAGAIRDHIRDTHEWADDREEQSAVAKYPGEAEAWKTWLALGYRRAQRRWKHHGSYSVGDLVRRINERTDKLNDSDGTHLRIQVNPQSLDVRIDTGERIGNRFVAC